MAGIDLQRRSDEVRKLFFAGFGQQVLKSGYDPEDVLQEIYRGLLVRNNGICPFDETKSSFGHYVHMVCDCVIKNYHRKESRKRKMEQVGMTTTSSKVMETVDAALASRQTNEFNQTEENTILITNLLKKIVDNPRNRMSTQDREDARKVLPILTQGFSKKEIQDQTGISPARLGRVMSILKRQVQLNTL